jgi:hypothetical protein
MLQKIFDIKKLFQGNKSTVQIPMNTLYGSKCLFYVANLALICIVIMLSIVSISIYFFMPVVDVLELSEKVNIQEAEEALPVVEPVDVESFDVEEKKVDAYAVIAKKNVFSPQRKEWVVKAVILNPSELAKKKKLSRKRVRAVKPKKIVLHGIVIAGGMRKALISNPLTGVSKKKTLYVEEGEEIEGYKVISIESDQIRLDWHGEEIIVTIYSGLIDSKQTDDSGKVNKVEYKYNEVENQYAEVDTDEVNEKTDDPFAEISDGMSISLMSMEPEHFFMPVINAAKLSEEVEIQDVAETFPYLEFIDVGPSGEEQKIEKAEIPKSFDLAAEEELKQKGLSEKPIKIVLHGIVMAGDIRKAMISNPLAGDSNKKTLYVEEGEEIEGYKVTSIEPDQIRLDWQGEEIIVTIHSGLIDNKQTDDSGKVNEVGTKYKEVEGQYAEVDTDEVNEKTDDSFAEISDEMLISLMPIESEHFFMPVMNGAKLSEEVEIQDVAETFPDIEFIDAGPSEEEQKIEKAEIPKSVDLAAEEELKQKALSDKPIKIVLHGIVIAGDIKKALVNIPISDVSKNMTLYVEEGDGLEGYKVTSIEPDRLRLDWQGEEVVVTFPPL